MIITLCCGYITLNQQQFTLTICYYIYSAYAKNYYYKSEKLRASARQNSHFNRYFFPIHVAYMEHCVKPSIAFQPFFSQLQLTTSGWEK